MASERRLLMLIAATVSVWGLVESSSESIEGRHTTSMYYVCPPDFIRLGSSCYYFSTQEETWQDAHFACKDRESNLTSPERWEDRNLRRYLNNQDGDRHNRWIGGIYDWSKRVWKWGIEMKSMEYQSFKRMPYRTPESLQFHCVAMVSKSAYRWDAFPCYEKKHFICQTKLKKVRKPERNKLRVKYNGNGNEVTAPKMHDIDNEIPNPLIQNGGRRRNNYKPARKNKVPYDNYVRDQATPNGVSSPLNSLTGATKRKNKPFPGYVVNKSDPEAAYLYNVNALKSGKTGLSNAQIERHLNRLERLRRREQAKLRRQEEQRYGQSARLTSGPEKYSTKRKSANSKEEKRAKGKNHHKSNKNKKSNKSSHSMERITQKTFLIDNKISELHPKQIVEVHSLSTE